MQASCLRFAHRSMRKTHKCLSKPLKCLFLGERSQLEKNMCSSILTIFWKSKNYGNSKKVSDCQKFEVREGRMNRWSTGNF